jgi:murein L,D-transpeptidase YafK
MQASRLYVYQNDQGQAKLVSDYYLTIGSEGFGKRVEGDNKTPVGVYRVTRFIDPATLPDLYGSGAFPINYPNKLDRAKQRTGYGIWLHGTPSNTYARAPWASEGCFVLSNEDFEHIQQYIDADKQTPVVLADRVDWITEQQLVTQRAEYLAVIEAWRQSWESLDTPAYLNFYARDEFNFGQGGYAPWAKRKVQINKAKTFVQVQTDLHGVFRYPGETDMFVVYFTQHYLSNNSASKTVKQQYWQKDASGAWHIIYEN